MRANDTQVGGDHYQQPEGVPQHWDLSAMYQWDGFQHCITKYVMRWKTKYSDPRKKLEDLKKALHFLQKYIEVHEQFLPKDDGMADKADLERALRLSAYEAANPRFVHDQDYLVEGGWGSGLNLYTCLRCKLKLTCHTLGEAHGSHDGVCPGQPPAP